MGLSPRGGIVEQVLVGGLLWLGGNSWQCLCGNLLRMDSLGNQSWVCRYLGQGQNSQRAPMGAEWATSHG